MSTPSMRTSESSELRLLLDLASIRGFIGADRFFLPPDYKIKEPILTSKHIDKQALTKQAFIRKPVGIENRLYDKQLTVVSPVDAEAVVPVPPLSK